MPDTYGRHLRMPSIGQRTNHVRGARVRSGPRAARRALITRRWNGSQPVKLTVTAQWAEVGWIGGQWQLSIGGYRAFVTDRGDAGSGHAWEWELYGNDDHNYWNGWVDSADEGKAAAETTIQVDAS